MSRIDFIAMLPQEIAESILSLLDFETFINCRIVCKNWHSIISANSHLWKVACENLGLNLETEQIPHEVVEYKRICFKMRNRFKKMQNGSEVIKIDTFNYNETTSCTSMYYHNGIVAIGTRHAIALWKLDPKPHLLMNIDKSNPGRVIFIKFDDFFLATYTSDSNVIVCELPSGKMLYAPLQIPGPRRRITSMTFNKEIDLLVFTTDAYAVFCCLSSRQILTQCEINDSVLDLYLIYNAKLPDGCNYMLLCSRPYSYFTIVFDSKQVSLTLKKTCDRRAVTGLHGDWCYLSRRGHVVDSYYYHMHVYNDSCRTIFYKCDIVSGNIEIIFDIRDCCMHLLGVGRKYACMLKFEAWEPEDPAKYVVIFDLCTRTEFATLCIPDYNMAGGLYNDLLACIGDTNWLDGFNGSNDKGVILVYKRRYEKTIDVVKWLK